MTVDHLKTIMAPPQAPVDSGDGEKWPEIQPGLPFPSDYKAFVSTFGSGRAADFIVIFNPFIDCPDVNFFDQLQAILGDLNELNQCDPDYYSYPTFPAPGGLIPIGVTDNGDYIFWAGDPNIDSNSWKVAIISSRSPEVEYFDSGLTAFLTGFLSGAIKPMSLPEFIVEGEIKFNKF